MGDVKCNRKTLKKIRTETLSLTQQGFAEAIGVRRATVSDWETGKRTPTLTLEQAKALDTLLDSAGLRLKDLPLEDETN